MTRLESDAALAQGTIFLLSFDGFLCVRASWCNAAADVKYAMAKEGISKPTIELLKSKTENAQKFGAYLMHCVCYGSGS